VLKRKIELPPVHLCPADEWRTVAARYADGLVGFGGARDFDGRLSFAPRLPHAWNEFAFSLRSGGRQIRARLTHDDECHLVDNGAPLNVLVRGRPHLLSPGTAVAIELPPP
jgi:alpha,alpha-trehalose phosphorylase